MGGGEDNSFELFNPIIETKILSMTSQRQATDPELAQVCNAEIDRHDLQ